MNQINPSDISTETIEHLFLRCIQDITLSTAKNHRAHGYDVIEEDIEVGAW